MPTPKAPTIDLSEKQQNCLSEIARQTTNPYRLVRRASIILAAAAGKSNSAISRQWQLDRNQVRYWRSRWLANTEKLRLCEQSEDAEVDLKQQVLATLADEHRPGTSATFTPEQVVQIVAIACEEPSASGRPVNHWTTEELADEAMKRGIVASISASSVRRFLGGSPATTPSQSLLAECHP
ncbi:MAG: helix-turn-helix domain-containing protein [Cyanobacteria bacterium J06559_1]